MGVEEIPGGVRYTLPRRPSPGLLAHAPLGLGLLLAAVGTALLLASLAGTWGAHAGLPTALGAAFAGVGGVFSVAGLFLGFGGQEIEWTGGVLRVRSRVGPLRWTRVRAAEGLRVISVIHTPAEVNGRPVREGPWAELSLLRATWEGGAVLTLSASYPRDWLMRIAEDWTKRLGPDGALERITREGYASTGSPPSRPPAGSRASVEASPERFTLTLPPRGLRGSNVRLLCFGLVWIAMLGGMNAGVYWMFGDTDLLSYAVASVFMALFSSAGLFMIGAAIHLSRRRSRVVIAAGRLTFESEGPFGRKRLEWRLDALGRVTCGPSDRSSDGVPHLALSFHPRGADPVHVLTERDPLELRWAAAVLDAERAKAGN